MHSSVLLEAEDIVNGSRDADYGDSHENLRRIAAIATAIGHPIDERGVCLVMMAVKLGRHLHKHKRDNLVDLCGYAEMMAREEARCENTPSKSPVYPTR